MGVLELLKFTRVLALWKMYDIGTTFCKDSVNNLIGLQGKDIGHS